jgi:enoyl-CoA hydratase/carnithine racemase
VVIAFAGRQVLAEKSFQLELVEGVVADADHNGAATRLARQVADQSPSFTIAAEHLRRKSSQVISETNGCGWT